MGDRFIPIRNVSNAHAQDFITKRVPKSYSTKHMVDEDSNEPRNQFNELLTRELFGHQITNQHRTFHYGRQKEVKVEPPSVDSPIRKSYSLSPISVESQKMLLRPQKPKRVLSRTPYKVLDAPYLEDDFYLNLIDWGASNVLAVGLASCVYLWSAHTGKVVKLHDFGPNNHVTSVLWTGKNNHVAVGTDSGLVHIWNAETCQRTRVVTGHFLRVAALAWNNNVLTSGGRDQLIAHHDLRMSQHFTKLLRAHEQEICGLQWDSSQGQLASGGNDNKLLVWDHRSDRPLYTFREHTAAVKAIGWSPHQRGILASGGGTIDRTLKIHNTLTGKLQNSLNTGSQICNLAWSKTSNEIVTTHGYARNQISVWKYPTLKNVVNLTGHTNRVLYLSMSPDGQSIVTGAGDETLRFWKLFDKKPTTMETFIR
ncbi:fizzy-like protein Mfr1 [Schizosaccharomyces japonicus yFS275]|uniref:Fizzy-like protein Mfr1 n=1 Tax=Schizosaccharomyces japonicus (strain yFS275 / FY16936) TaxID=402676 RepID=B6K7X9_SCHJY|nr:fizzy-like protein Mfr1 [Schizosaccharomyces japonicus yFS275]EEB09633.2 fizzy-like protein Mfr1 [Schizosaccharomyces japonicus yFS275]